MQLSLHAALPRRDFPPPRPFQAATREKLRERILLGDRRIMVCSPTGSGKTMLAMYLIDEALKKNKTAIFVADRITLIDQTAETAYSLGLTQHGIIQANHEMTDARLPFQIASAQTLGRRHWPDSDLIIIDEAHTQLKAWTEHIKTCRGIVIGLSATPFSAGLGNRFDYLINAVTMRELVEQQTLVPMRVFAARRINMEGAAKSDGEWTSVAAGERGIQIVGDVVAEYRRHAYGRKTICFGATIKHCEELARQFNEAGIPAQVYCQTTPDSVRRRLVAEFRKADSLWSVLISVEALAKGFDVRDVSCIIDCRPLRKSFSSYVQMIDRGLRESMETGKTDCLVLDHSGNSVRFAADFAALYANGLDALDSGEKLDKTVRKEPRERTDGACPSCGFYPFAKMCMGCGFTVQSHSMVAHAQGHLEEVSFAGQTLAPTHRDLFNQLLSYARKNSAPDKQFWRARFLYRDMIGMLPPTDWTMANSPEVAVTRATSNRIQYLRLRKLKGRAKGDLLRAGDKIRRCGTEDHPRSDNGAYWFDGERGWVRVWDGSGETHWWNDPQATPWGDAEKRAWAARRASIKADEAARFVRGAERARVLLESARPAPHAYLQAKGLATQPGLVTADGSTLLVPMWSFETGAIINAQRIFWVPEAMDEDGVVVRAHWTKKFVWEANPKGAVFRIGPVRCAETWLCEGYVTGLSIHAALAMLNLRASVLVTFSDHNMVQIARRVPGRKLVFADHDATGAGQRAAALIGAPTVRSAVMGEDANDLMQREGLIAVCREIMQARSQ